MQRAGLPAFAVAATVWAGLAFVNLSTLGSTYAANVSGEIKKVNTAMPLSQIGIYAPVRGLLDRLHPGGEPRPWR